MVCFRCDDWLLVFGVMWCVRESVRVVCEEDEGVEIHIQRMVRRLTMEREEEGGGAMGMRLW